MVVFVLEGQVFLYVEQVVDIGICGFVDGVVGVDVLFDVDVVQVDVVVLLVVVEVGLYVVGEVFFFYFLFGVVVVVIGWVIIVGQLGGVVGYCVFQCVWGEVLEVVWEGVVDVIGKVVGIVGCCVVFQCVLDVIWCCVFW